MCFYEDSLIFFQTNQIIERIIFSAYRRRNSTIHTLRIRLTPVEQKPMTAARYRRSLVDSLPAQLAETCAVYHSREETRRYCLGMYERLTSEELFMI